MRLSLYPGLLTRCLDGLFTAIEAGAVCAQCTFGRLGVVPVAVTLAAGIVSGAAHAQATTVEIGFAAPLSGNSANFGKDMQMGVQLALDEVNAGQVVIAGKPVKFELQVQDDQSDPRIAVQAAQHLADEKVAAVIGHFNSGNTLAAIPVYKRAGIPLIVPCSSNPTITHQGFDLLYRPYGTDFTVAESAAHYAVETLKAKRIAVVDDRTTFGQGIADEFEKGVRAAGGTIVTHEYTTDTAVDFRAILTSIKSDRADLVFFGGLSNQGSLFVKQARQLAFDGQLMAGPTFANQHFLQLTGDAAQGMIGIEQGAPLAQLDSGRAFLKKFHDKYGTDPIGFAGYAYNATLVVVNGMKQANSIDPAVFGPAISKLSFDGILGPISFDKNGDLNDAKVTLYKAGTNSWGAVATVSAK